MPSVRISPGRLTALWLVIRSLDKLGGTGQREELRRYASRTSLRSGGLPVTDGLTLSLEGGFLIPEGSDRVFLSSLGREALALEAEDEPGPELRRLFLSALLLRDPPAWVAFWQGDETTIDLIIPESERRLLTQSNLLPIGDEDDLANWALWEALRRVPLPDESGAARKLVGDAGEELSIDYERQRLNQEGFGDLADRVRWVARESPAYGFDILSCNGAFNDGLSPETAIGIEVKSCSRPTPSSFPFFLTVHEWRTAARLQDRYVFHFWEGVTPGPPPSARNSAPLILSPTLFTEHLPKGSECEDACTWYTAEVHFPLLDLQ